MTTLNLARVWACNASVLALCAGFNLAVEAQEPVTTDENPSANEDTIVVLGGLIPRPVSQVGSAISVISAEDLQAQDIVLVSDILRDVPGLAVNRAGPEGALTQVRIRGAEGNHTLVYIDGVEANSPVSSEFNFANLVAADIAQIEVLRGAQSALYGSEAIGGVIAVTTRAPEQGVQAGGEVEYGAFNTSRAFAGVGVGSEMGGIRASVQYYDTDGISASPTGPEKDGFTNLTSAVKGVFTPTDTLRIEGVVRLVDAQVDTDRSDWSTAQIVDADGQTQTDDVFAKLDATADVLDGAVSVRGFTAFAQSKSSYLSDGAETSASRGERFELGLQANAGVERGNIRHGFGVAVEREWLDYRNESPWITGGVNVQDDAQTSLVGEYTLAANEAVFVSAAVRQDFNTVFADATTVRLSGAYLIPPAGLRLHASAGQGITDPSFTERFGFNPGTFIGNPDLTPERSTGFDIGLEKAFLDDALVVDVTYFRSDLTDEINTSYTYDAASGAFVSTPVNADGESDRSGIEVMVEATLGAGFTLDGHYTNLDASNADGSVEVRRPEHTGAVNLSWTGRDDTLGFSVGVDHNGDMADISNRTLDAYTLVRVAGRYRIANGVEVFARADNVLDAEYQEIFGYNTPGAAAYLGVRLSRK